MAIEWFDELVELTVDTKLVLVLNMTVSDIQQLEQAAAHSDVTLALAQKESAEHMHGMKEVYDAMRRRPLIVKAYAVNDARAPDSAKTVHFVRHGQGFHNFLADKAKADGREWIQFTQDPNNPYIAPELLDSPLTEKGRQQAYLLQPRVQSLPLELVVFSPNCRALQTGIIVFEQFIGNVPMLAHEMAREENGVHLCDKRRPVSQQRLEFPQVDFSLLEHNEDPLFREDRRETKMELGERIYQFFEWLSTRPEQHVAIVSHSGWLLTVMNGFVECEDESLKAWFQTGEMRSVKLSFLRQSQQ